MAEQDVSKKTVAVLLVLAIVLAVTGTWLAFTMEPLTIRVGPTEDSAGGQVNLEVEGNVPPVVDQEGGRINLRID